MIDERDFDMLWNAWEQGLDLGEVLNRLGKALHGVADLRVNKSEAYQTLRKSKPEVQDRLQKELDRVRMKLQVGRVQSDLQKQDEQFQRINLNVLRAAGDVIFKSARQAQASLTNDKHNHIDLAVGSSSIFIKGEADAKERPFNTYAGMTGAGSTLLTGEALVKARKECARHCKMQGRTSCRYCLGEGFAAKSARENAPSRSINKARDMQAETSRDGAQLWRKV